MANFPFSVLLIVLLASIAAVIPAATAEAPEKAPFGKQSPIDDLLCPFDFNFTKCWVSIARVDKCAVDLVKSITSFEAIVNADCCNAISDVSAKCFSIFGGMFAPILKSHCNGYFPNAPLAKSPESST